MADKHPKKAAKDDGGISYWIWLGLLGLLIAIPLPFIINSHYSHRETPQVILRQGTYAGKVLSNSDHPVPIEAWFGIPYAKPPVGKLRFRRPRPISAGRRKADATEYGYRCPGRQLLKSPNLPEENEDCLTVNVFKQRHSPDNQPVMVYIHGGAFNRGYASMHDTASMLAWTQEPFIAVSFNYRLGALGFLPSSISEKEGILNLGLRDQTLVLEWVQQNIEKFGGNPEDVTVVGLSAGAHSVGHHIMNVNDRRELFHKAVIESGGPTSRVVHPANSTLHQDQFQKLLAKTGCQNEADASQIQCLRGVSSTRLIEAQAEVFDEYNPSLRWAWQPCIDGDLISRRPIDAWKSGKWHNVPILTGFNHNEGTYYVPKTSLHSGKDFTKYFASLLPQLTGEDLTQLSVLYPDPDGDSSSPYRDTRDLEALGITQQFKRIEAAYGQYAYVCPVRQTAHLGAAAQGEPIYLYHWALNKTVLGGANHADQMPFEAMSPSIRDISESLDRIAETFHSYLTSFILSGDPNKIPGLVPDRSRWEAFGAEGTAGDTMIFGSANDEAAGGEGEGIVADFIEDQWAKEECTFWWDKSEVPEYPRLKTGSE